MSKLPFPHYPGSAEAAADAGGKTKDQQATFFALKSNLSGQEDKASQQASGDINASVGASTTSPQNDAEQAAGAALVGGGAVNHFADAIRTYNGHIDRLNEKYETEKAANFHVAADAGHAEGNTDAQNDAAHDGKVAEADRALQAKLEKERQGYEDELDKAADFAAQMLIAGPTQATVLALFIAGNIDAEAAAAALGTTLSALNNVRMWTATIKGLEGFKDSIPALAQWMLKKDLNKLTRGSMTKWQVTKELRALVSKNAKSTMTFAQRVAAYKEAKQLARGAHLKEMLKPGGNLFGKYGYVPKHASNLSKFRSGLGKVGSVTGKVLPFLAIPAGGYGLYDTYQNRENLTTPEEVNGYVGSGATLGGGLVAGGMIVAGAFPPAGLAIAAGLGVVALGSLAVDVFNWEDDLADAADWVGDTASDIGEGAEELWHDVTPW